MSLTRRNFLRITAAGTLTAALGATIGYASALEPNHLVVTRTVIPFRRLPASFDGFRLVLLTDLHLYPFTTKKMIQRAIDQTNSLQPDLVLLGGDFVCSSADAAFELGPMLQKLNAKHGLFAVFGNYDYFRGAEVVHAALREVSIPLLVNEGVVISRAQESIFLAGLDSASAGNPDPKKAFAKRRAEPVSLALVHEPDYVDELSQLTQVDLQLSGHTHGGQIRCPGIGPIILPPLGKKYVEGLHQVGATQIYTTRGVGMVDLPLRFDCPPEVTEIILTKA
jgi:uncharacterized protein